MTIIYRVEKVRGKDKGWGLYSSATPIRDILGVPSFITDKWPSVNSDAVLSKHIHHDYTGTEAVLGSPAYDWKDVRYGFRSKTQMKRWLFKAEWRSTLDANGFAAGIYKVRDFLLGEHQSVFDPTTAQRIGELKLTEIK